MKKFMKIYAAFLFLSMSANVLAVTVSNRLSGSEASPDVIERGGMITSTQVERRTIAVDLKEYPLAGDVKLMSRSGKPVKTQDLTQGTLIEFVTKRGLGGVEEIKMIEVVRSSR